MRAAVFLFEIMQRFIYPVTLICLLLHVLPSCKKESLEHDLKCTEAEPVLTAVSTNIKSIIYYGPEKFTIVSGKPVIAIRSFANQNFEYLEDFVLKIQNGDDGRTKVKKIEILVDGALIIGNTDFNGENHFVTKKLRGLSSNSVLEVRLDGSRGRFVNILVEATLKSSTITAIGVN